MMSCRVLKRGVELFVLQSIVELARQEGYSLLRGEFIPTKKNDLVKDHYRNLGFSEISENVFDLEINKYRPSAKVKINQYHLHGKGANTLRTSVCL
jgi:predicted enzyme involved in methoxymalonyl-ACP biosynthesis